MGFLLSNDKNPFIAEFIPNSANITREFIQPSS